jgi:putative addiction module component (TIGR02574 family)
MTNGLSRSSRDAQVDFSHHPKEPFMSTLLAELAQRAHELPPEERAQLAQELLESVDCEADPDVQAAWEAEIASRVATYERGEAKLVVAEDVFEEAKRLTQ